MISLNEPEQVPDHQQVKSMFKLSASLRLAIGLAFLGLSVFLASQTLGLGQNELVAVTNLRSPLAETIALYVSREAANGSKSDLAKHLQSLVDRNDDLLSVGLRRKDQVFASSSDHDGIWETNKSQENQMLVPISVRDEKWGRVEVCFKPIVSPGYWGFLTSRPVRQFMFVLAAAILLYSLYLKKMLRHLDPSRVIPDRVRSALDTFAEGLLVIDRGNSIVLANKSFGETVGHPSTKLQGRDVNQFPWENSDSDNLPWVDALNDGKVRLGRMVDLRISEHKKITYMVNASPIFSDSGDLQGVLSTFDDVTLHEQRKQELEQTLRVLGESREKIRKQNEKLRVLATRDPLTGCLNRRAFFEEVDKIWASAGMREHSVACIMIDVDHFKAVNDTHGHSTGDEVLRVVGKTLIALEAADAIPCRYGGEEFCVLIEGYSMEAAREFAEEIRTVLEASKPAGIEITASLGVSITGKLYHPFEETLEQADQCLYIAKGRGRNRVICWTDFDESELEKVTQGKSSRTPGETRSQIPFHAVTALISALSYRDASTAEHSRRVADLCVTVASELKMPVRDQYVLETAALLHDIGKIGTPDSVLLKPGPLDDDEHEVMSHHDMIGIEIIRTTFDDPRLLEIVSNHFAWYGGTPKYPGMPTGENIPLGSRVLTICDTYDAIVTDRVYRKGAKAEAAFAELRRFAGKQFDPNLVEVFIKAVQSSQPKATQFTNVPKRSALRIGLIMDQMTAAMEAGNLAELKQQAGQLKEAANEFKLGKISELASELADVTADETNVEDLVEIANTLLDLCRMTQRAYLGVGQESRRRREQMAKRAFQPNQ